MVRSTVLAGVAASGLGLLGVLAASPGSQPGQIDLQALGAEFGESTFTRPGQDAEIRFQLSTQVRQISVSVGERVTKGELLIQGDDGEDRAAMEVQKARTETDLPLRRAKEQHELAKVELLRMETAGQGGGANPQELARARVTAIIAGIDVEQAMWNGAQEKVQLRRFEERVKRYALRAPFDGQVETVNVDVGDTLREGEPVVRVVSIDPLHLDVNASLAQAFALSKGDSAWVLVGVPGSPVVLRGMVTGISPVADFAARSQRVRIEVSNPDGLPAGLPAWVRFSEPGERFRSMIADDSLGG